MSKLIIGTLPKAEQPKAMPEFMKLYDAYLKILKIAQQWLCINFGHNFYYYNRNKIAHFSEDVLDW